MNIVKAVWAGFTGDVNRAFNRCLNSGTNTFKLTLVMITIGFLFLLLYYLGMSLFFTRCSQFAESAIPLAGRISALALSLAWPLIFLSASICAISTLLLQKDTRVIFASPAGSATAFWLGYIRVLIRAGGLSGLLAYIALIAMIRPLALPGMTWLYILLALMPYIFTAVSLAALFALVAGAYFNVHRTRQLLLLLTLFAGTAMIATIRVTEPEKLLNPQVFSQFEDYVLSLSLPLSMLLPGEWAGQVIISGDFQYSGSGKGIWLLYGWLISGFLWTILGFMNPLYEKAWQNSNTNGHRSNSAMSVGKENSTQLPEINSEISVISRTLTGTLLKRDMILLSRDAVQSSQSALFVVMTGLYIFNITRIAIPDRISFVAASLFNIGFALAVTAAICARFVYTAFSAEGSGLRLLFSAPVLRRHIFRAKLMIHGIPLFCLAIILVFGGWAAITRAGISGIIASRDITGMRNATLINTSVLAPVLILMAMAFGTLWLDTSERPTEAKALSLGAIIYMTASGLLLMLTLGIQFIIPMMPSGPGSIVASSPLAGNIQILLSLMPAISIGIISLSQSLKHLERMEI